MMNATSSVLSVGRIASDLQHSVTEILHAADALGIRPSLVINRILHFDECDVGMIGKYLRDHDARK
jgi:hypothetical protein